MKRHGGGSGVRGTVGGNEGKNGKEREEGDKKRKGSGPADGVTHATPVLVADLTRFPERESASGFGAKKTLCFNGLTRSLGFGVWIAALVLLGAETRSEPLTIIEAQATARFNDEGYPLPVGIGDTIHEPTRFSSRFNGSILLANAETAVQLNELSTVVFEKIQNPPVRLTQQAFTNPRLFSRGHHHPSGTNLTLHFGTLLIESLSEQISLCVGGFRVDANQATLAVTTSPFRGECISVFKGQARVRNQDCSITPLSAGQRLQQAPKKSAVLSHLNGCAEDDPHLSARNHFIEHKAISQALP